VFLYIDGKLVDQGAVTGTIYPDRFHHHRQARHQERIVLSGLLDDVFYTPRFLGGDISLLYGVLSGQTVSFVTPWTRSDFPATLPGTR